jgi:hypothetical protein
MSFDTELDDLFTDEEQDEALQRAARRELKRRETVAVQQREMRRLLRGGLVMFGAILGMPIKQVDGENITIAHEFYIDREGHIAWARESNCKYDACSPVSYEVYAPLTAPPVEAPIRGRPVVDRSLREQYGDLQGDSPKGKPKSAKPLTQKQKDKLAKAALADVRKRASRIGSRMAEPSIVEQSEVEDAAEEDEE